MTKLISKTLAGLLAACLLMANTQAALKHRYSFTTDANDSIGTAHGTLFGNAFVGDGALNLDGSLDTYVQLPPDLIQGYGALTVEAWATYGDNGNWPRLFDFGDSNDGGLGRNYIFFTPHSGQGDSRFVISDADPGYNHEELVSIGGVQDNTGKTHVACVINPAKGWMAFYTNGVIAAQRTTESIPLTSVSNVLNYIGKSLYPDAFLNATIDEFRVYDNALSAADVAASFASGPDTPSTDPGALLSIRLEVEPAMLLGGFQTPVVFGTFAKATNINISGTDGISFTSSAASIVRVQSDGSLNAVGVGTAKISATYQGQTATNSVTVALAPAVLTHRYSFNDAAGSTTAKDSAGTADASLKDGAILNGDGNVTLDGVAAYVDLPNGIISKMTNATFETWVTWTLDSVWQRIFDFGSNSAGEDAQGTGQTYLFLSPRAGGVNVPRFTITSSSGGGETPVLNSPSALSLNKETYFAVVYNASGRSAKLYVDGRLVASGTATIPLRNIQDVNNWLGRSNWPDPFFNGQINEFRIYEGALDDTQIAFSVAAGPNVIGSDPGAFKSLNISIPTNSLFLGGVLANAQLYATYEHVTNVNISAFSGVKFETSDSSVITVTTNGVVEPVGIGAATLKASYQGQTTSINLTVTAPPDVITPKLVHRYSFDEAAGSTVVKDSVGGADGGLIGTGTFTNGVLSLPGTDGYVDLPNGIISSLTDATFECWTTWKGTRAWERLFDFGSNTSGEDTQGTGETYIFFCPRSGIAPNTARFTITTGSGAGENPVVDLPSALSTTTETHVVVSYNYTAGSVRVFINGKRLAVAPAVISLHDLNDINNWIGRSNWPDPNYLGLINEFRIYEGALSDAQVAADYAAGPNTLQSDIASRQLSVSASGNGVVISWPDSATGFALESTAKLGAGAAWTPVAQTPSTANGRNSVTLPLTGTSQFFRLRK